MRQYYKILLYQRIAEVANKRDLAQLRAFVRDIRTHCGEDSVECQEMVNNIREIMDEHPEKRSD